MMNQEQKEQFESLEAFYGKGACVTEARGKSQRTYQVFVSRRNDSFYIWAVCLDDNVQNIDAGNCDFTRYYGGTSDPRPFLDIPEDLLEKPAFTSNFTVSKSYRRDGLASILFSIAIEELKDKKGVHYEGFTPDGLRSLLPKFERAGYQRCNLVAEAEPPRWMQSLDSWVYLDYSNL